MLINESIWIKNVLKKIPSPKRVLNIGSSSFKFRKEIQPHISKNVFYPLSQKGAKIIHLDKKKKKGVNIRADVCSNSFQLKKQFDLVICSSLFEHLRNSKKQAAENISSVVDKGGYLLVTAPKVYRYHEDPIDNLERFSIEELKSLFSQFEEIHASYVYEEKDSPFIRNMISCTKKAIQAKKLSILKVCLFHCVLQSTISCCLLKKS